MAVGAGREDERTRRMFPFLLMKSNRMLGVRLGPSPFFWIRCQRFRTRWCAHLCVRSG